MYIWGTLLRPLPTYVVFIILGFWGKYLFCLRNNSIKESDIKIKDIYKVREIAGENLVVEQGKLQSDMTKVISLNSTALLLWNELRGTDFTLETAANVLVSHFGIAPAAATTDAQKWVDALTNCGIIE
ncbi:MAG: PqqD family protein [Bacteroides sp.]|nr:PqqD family protein [Bacteroides sp.]